MAGENITFDALKDKLTAALPQLQDLLITQAQAALSDLAKGSAEAGKLGVQCLQEMSRVGLLMADGKISKETAALAVGNYLEAIKLAGNSVTEMALSQAYDRGVALLRSVGAIALEVLQVAVKMGISEASAFAGGIKIV